MAGLAALHEVIVPKLATLSPALREAADYVINNSDSVAMLSLRRVAEDSNVSPATFSRLAKSLDFESYEALRNICRSDMRLRARSFADKTRDLQRLAADGTGSLLVQHGAASIANLETAMAQTSEDGLASIADELAGAKAVFAHGAMSSGSLIDHTIYTARLALPNWRVALSGEGSMATALQDIGKGDVLLVLSQSPYAQSGVSLASEAGKRGARVVAISDSYASPVVSLADRSLVVPTDSPHFFASEVATIFVLETLVSMVVQRAGAKAQERIAAIENENHRRGEYWRG